MLTNLLSFSMLDPGFLTEFMYILFGEYMLIMKQFFEIWNPFALAPAFLCSTVPVKNLACHTAMIITGDHWYPRKNDRLNCKSVSITSEFTTLDSTRWCLMAISTKASWRHGEWCAGVKWQWMTKWRTKAGLRLTGSGGVHCKAW